MFSRWTDAGVFFVTRLKSNAVYEVVENREVPQGRNILEDRVIRLTGDAGKKCEHELRVVTVWDKEKDRYIDLLTNHLEFGQRRSRQSTRTAGRSSCFSRRSNRT